MDTNREGFFRGVSDAIDRYGQFIVWVADEPPFGYTIGNAGCSLPELLMFGPQDCCYVINTLSEIMRERGFPFDHGEQVSIEINDELGSYPVMIVDIDHEHARENYTVQAGQHWKREDYAVQQVLLCDMNRKFPHESGYLGCGEPLLNIAPIPFRT